MDLTIKIWKTQTPWEWALFNGPFSGDDVAYGTSSDYHQACEQARIAWEQHGKGEE